MSDSTVNVTVHLGSDVTHSILESVFSNGKVEPFAVIQLGRTGLIARDADALAALAQACTRALIDLRKAYEKGTTNS